MEIKSLHSYIIILLLILSSVVLYAQKEKTTNDLVNEFSASLDSLSKNEAHNTKLVQDDQQKFTLGNNAYDSLQLDRQLKQFDFTAMHQNRCFTWQFYSSIFIFIIVMFIVGMGLVLSYKQFQLLEIQVKANVLKPKSEITTIEAENTNIEISQTGLKINTGVIGLAILFLSLAFFFLYLKYVYQIEVMATTK
ncbi:hypothetical protein SAMN05444372_10825 [Flavobacterium micromati]|uniref:Uncharacterized protein n=1 Tax=Flavobacterium micromati TaxID=229205 RepID=A0A1M5LD10_9FLAO|nr:hypothetical protein [Flavobacterium micromati]SHG62835.1 hypothetical protein SAMN05444372_10825 [Flavobacterium micromati]